MALNSFSGDNEDSAGGPPKTTYYQFENPDHPESKEHDDPEKAKRHFDAARFVQSHLGTDRHNLVGEFLWAVYCLEDDDNEEPLQNLVSQLTE